VAAVIVLLLLVIGLTDAPFATDGGVAQPPATSPGGTASGG
jgi:hypothetical protein